MSAAAVRPAPVAPPYADRPPEARGVERDHVRLLVSTPAGDAHRRFDQLPEILEEGDLLIVNASAVLPASLPARGSAGEFRVHASTQYGEDLWLVEPRWGAGTPGPVPIEPGETIRVGGVPARLVGEYPGIRRLSFLRVEGDLAEAMRAVGEPIRYGYLAPGVPPEAYRTEFGEVPGSVEMPSAGRPFTRGLVDRLRHRGIRLASIVLHAGVSSLEEGDVVGAGPPVFPEPFDVPRSTLDAIARARAGGHRAIAVGTTVVRALESACDGCGLRASRGFTRLYLSPETPVRAVDGLLTGFHDARTTHLALLGAVAGPEMVRRSYAAALGSGYLWHEFGDSHLILPGPSRAPG
jgi:S-adenosylmethionine:tRNA ribosyltransferase-isomerase